MSEKLSDIVSVELRNIEYLRTNRPDVEAFVVSAIEAQEKQIIILEAEVERLREFARWCQDEMPSGNHNIYQIEGSAQVAVDPELFYELRDRIATIVQE